MCVGGGGVSVLLVDGHARLPLQLIPHGCVCVCVGGGGGVSVLLVDGHARLPLQLIPHGCVCVGGGGG